MIDSSLKSVVVGTRNIGKVAEIRDLLLNLPFELHGLDEFDVPPVEETGTSYEENSRLKAIAYAKATKLSALADDSGLEVDALGGLPGVRSARFGGESASQAEKTAKLLAMLDEYPDADRKARFVCVLTLSGWSRVREVVDEPEILHVSRGTVEGHIACAPKGDNGFGYDPIFIPDGYNETFGELTDATKNVISHRAKALVDMREFLEGWIGQT